MELWATGFNACNQFQLDVGQELPRDLPQFQCILVSEDSKSALKLVQAAHGVRSAEIQSTYSLVSVSPKHIAIAGNDQVVIIRDGLVQQYQCIEDYPRNIQRSFPNIKNPKQVVANQTSFTLLTDEGLVWTWGDNRYEACLGRDVTNECPADEPTIVEELITLPESKVVQLASGGYMTAAVTDTHDLYIWAGGPHHAQSVEQLLSCSPMPVDIHGKDVLNVGVGMDHVIALTTDRKVYTVGSGNNGQLGINMDRSEQWKEVLLLLRDTQHVVGVAAGYKSSFAFIEDII